MAGMGPAPKEQKRRRNADAYSDLKATLVDDGELSGPELKGEWSEYVQEWYDTWRRSPQAKAFVSTDWMRLRMIAPLVSRMETSPHHLVMAEIRQSESLLGATYADRLRGRMKVEKPAPDNDVPAGVAAIDNYRNRLAS